jgi:tetratricopeptide (TPR) repeat protein
MSGRTQAIALLAAVAVLLALAVVVQMQRDRVYAATPVEQQLLYINAGGLMEKVALSYDAALADVYWVRALQHYGGDRLRPDAMKRYDLLYPLLDLTTSLDPYFTVAYRFGAIFLAEPYPGGAGRPELAIALLEKGVEATPQKWEYYHDIGFIYYWRLHDYKQAAAWFQRGGDMPGGPWWLKTYAAVMLTRGGDRQASRFMWQQILQTADNDWLKENAQVRLLQLDALDEIDLLGRVVEEFKRRTGRIPESWAQLIAAGALRGVPTDPAGTPYELDVTTGAVRLSESSKIHPLPVEPTRL